MKFCVPDGIITIFLSFSLLALDKLLTLWGKIVFFRNDKYIIHHEKDYTFCIFCYASAYISQCI